MSMTITLVHAGHNRLRYLLVSTGGTATGTITSDGSASPDLFTDSLNGPIKNLANAFANGFGKLPAGALTQAQARALWLSQNSESVAAITDGLPPTAKCDITFRVCASSGPLDVAVDANQSGGKPTLTINSGTQTGSAWSAYLDVEIGGAIGD